MLLRFWRRFGIAPFTTLNVSKGGLSVSFGRRGLHLTLGRHGARVTAGLPGTGLSLTDYRRYKDLGGRNQPAVGSDVADLVSSSIRQQLGPAPLRGEPDDEGDQ